MSKCMGNSGLMPIVVCVMTLCVCTLFQVSISEIYETSPKVSFEECLKRNGNSTPSSDSELRNMTCYCDDLCWTYDDCCYDSDSSNSFKNQVQLPMDLVECKDLGNAYMAGFLRFEPVIKTVYVVVRCPTNYDNDDIRRRCEDETIRSTHRHFDRLPVNGKNSKILYHNYYCAVCNGEDKVIFWTVVANNAVRRNVASGDSNIAPGLDALFISFRYPNYYPARKCRNAVRKCKADWVDTAIAKSCEEPSPIGITSYVCDSRNISAIYRNIDCAKCNNLTHIKDNCSGQVSHYGNDGIQSTLPAFRLLFDIDPTTATLEDSNNKRVVFSSLCECLRHAARFADMCREFFRAARLKSGLGDRCDEELPNLTSRHILPSFNNDSETQLNCTLVFKFSLSDYVVLSNGSAFVNKTGAMYGIDEYRLDLSFLYVCAGPAEGYTVMFQFDRVQAVLSFAGLTVSLVSLVVLFIIYLSFRVLLNTPGKCVLCLVISVFAAQFLFLFVGFQSHGCYYRAAIMHFAFLASFTWTNALAFDTCRTFASGTINPAQIPFSKRFLLYSLYAWCVPGFVVGFGLILNGTDRHDIIQPHYGEPICWITRPGALVALFVVPVSVALGINFVLFFVTVFHLHRSSTSTQTARRNTGKSKSLLPLYAKLSLIMGLAWVFGFIAIAADCEAVWYLFIIFNTLQGTFLCLSFICTGKVFRLMRSKFQPSRGASASSARRTAQTTSTQTSTTGSIRESIMMLMFRNKPLPGT